MNAMVLWFIIFSLAALIAFIVLWRRWWPRQDARAPQKRVPPRKPMIQALEDRWAP